MAAEPAGDERPGARWRTWLAVGWPAAASLGALVVGAVLIWTGHPTLGNGVWALAIAATAVVLARDVAVGLWRREPGVDVIALLALIGAVLLGEFLAGVIIAVMLTGGHALEDYAAARARRDLTALLARAPRVAHRRTDDGIVDVAVEEVATGDVVLVRPGEVIPVDGVVTGGRAVVDEAAITGESRPVERDDGDRVASGAVNAGGPVEIRASAPAAESTYAGLVRLVEQAQAERAPFTRLADRTAGWFVPFTLVVAGAAWAVSGDPVRALAVLVVATPCPLILATPIAITAGMSRLARRGVIVKGGGALEALARAEVVLLDKTGTVTRGRPRAVDVVAFADAEPDEVVRLAASLDQVSAHVFAPAVVEAARERSLGLTFPSAVSEEPGAGISGVLDGATVRVGRGSWVIAGPWPAEARAVARRTSVEGTSSVFVSRDGAPVGALLLEDVLRPGAGRVVRALRGLGVERVTLLTGDHADLADLVGDTVDVDRVLAERTPEDKVAAVRDAGVEAVAVMVGDGVNDAPALAHADVGVAMGAAGATASSEAADVVITVDDLDRVRESIAVAQRTRRVAWQSITLGMGLAAVAMVFAAVGWLAPVAGALVQEVIDLAAIGNALRALRGRGVAARPELAELSEQLRAVEPRRDADAERVRRVADRLPTLAGPQAREELAGLYAHLEESVVAHELDQEASVFPVVADVAGDEDPTGLLRHTHKEIVRRVRLLGRTIDDLPEAGPSPDELPELQRLLYGLHAILRLHLAQEAEVFQLLEDAAERRVEA